MLDSGGTWEVLACFRLLQVHLYSVRGDDVLEEAEARTTPTTLLPLQLQSIALNTSQDLLKDLEVFRPGACMYQNIFQIDDDDAAGDEIVEDGVSHSLECAPSVG